MDVRAPIDRVQFCLQDNALSFYLALKHGINLGVKSLPLHGCAALCDTVLMISHPALVYGFASQSCSVNTLSC